MQNIIQNLKKYLCIDLFRLISLIFAGYFLYIFHLNVGLPPEKDISTTSITYLILFIFFLLLPQAKSIKLGKFLEYEAKITEIKKEVQEFKDETRQIISMQNMLISTVTNTLNQNINITIPGLKEAEEAKEELDEAIKEPERSSEIEDKIQQFLASTGGDINLALAKLRIDIERELRKILGKKTETEDATQMRGPFLSARSLFKEFIQKYPEYKGMYKSFDYILKVCNAAIHGQVVSQAQADEALYMGIKILNVLEKVNNNIML